MYISSRMSNDVAILKDILSFDRCKKAIRKLINPELIRETLACDRQKHRHKEANLQKREYLTQLHLFDEARKEWFWNSDQTDHEKLDNKLNKLGEEGWELVAVRASSTSVAFYHFKRPIE